MLGCRWDWYHGCGFRTCYSLRKCHRLSAHRNILFLCDQVAFERAGALRCSPNSRRESSLHSVSGRSIRTSVVAAKLRRLHRDEIDKPSKTSRSFVISFDVLSDRNRHHKGNVATTRRSVRESSRPCPLIEFWHIHAMFVSVVLALNLHIAQHFFGVSPRHFQRWHPVDNVDGQAKTDRKSVV